MFSRALPFLLCIAASTANAHPHLFVETEVTVVFDDEGRFEGVRLVWTYDDYFSLLITEDLGLDPDGDLVLTEEEAAILTAHIVDWPEGFAGDVVIARAGAPLTLGEVREHAGTMDEGVVREIHLRTLAQPVPMDDAVTVQVFDPFYYTAYSIVGEIGIEGRNDCSVAYAAADLNKAYALVDELLYGRPASDVGPDEAFPEVGQAFADTLTVTCADS